MTGKRLSENQKIWVFITVQYFSWVIKKFKSTQASTWRVILLYRKFRVRKNSEVAPQSSVWHTIWMRRFRLSFPCGCAISRSGWASSCVWKRDSGSFVVQKCVTSADDSVWGLCVQTDQFPCISGMDGCIRYAQSFRQAEGKYWDTRLN